MTRPADTPSRPRLRSLALLLVLIASVAVISLPRQTSDAQSTIPAALANSKPFQRAQFFYEQRAWPGGYIPAGAQRRGMDQIAQYRASRPEFRSVGQWEEVGPAPIEAGGGDPFVDKTSHSGRVAAIGVNPRKSKQMVIGGAQGGLWFSKNNGKAWSSAGDDLVTLAFGAIDWVDKKTIYAATGEAVFSGNSYAGLGVYKSTNGGKKWTMVNTTNLDALSSASIIGNPKDPDEVVLATTASGKRRQAGLGTAGIYVSNDGGKTWTRTLSGQATHLLYAPGDFNTQYAAIGSVFGSAANGVYRSTNGGNTWTKLAGPWDGAGAGRIELAMAPSNEDILWVGVQNTADFGLLGLYRSTNASSRDGRVPSFQEVTIPGTTSTTSYCRTQCWYDHVLAVDPNDEDILYAGGVFLFRFDGTNWTELLPGHVDVHALEFAGKTLISGNDGGVFSSKNRGNTWKSLNDGLRLTQFYHGGVHPSRSKFLLGGTQDNGTLLRDTGAPREAGRAAVKDSWTRILGGDGADVEVSRDNPDTDWAVATQNQRIRRTTDGGNSYSLQITGMNTGSAPFIGVFAMCPNDSDTFVAGTDRAWHTSSFFTAGTVPWTDQGPKIGGGDVRAIAFAPSDNKCQTYAIGTSTGEVWVTKNGGGKWIKASKDLPGRAVTDLNFDNDDEDTLWVTHSSFNEFTPGTPGHVFRSTNATANKPKFNNVSPPVNLPANAIVIQPGSNIAWVGSDVGVWQQTGAGRGSVDWTFHGPDNGMPNVAVFDLQATKDLVAAFTYGRGVFTYGK